MHFSAIFAVLPLLGAVSAVPTRVEVSGPLAPRTTPPSFPDLWDQVSNFKAYSHPNTDEATVSFHIETPNCYNQTVRHVSTNCKVDGKAQYGLGPFDGTCDDDSVKFSWKKVVGEGWQLKVIKAWDYTVGYTRL
jgi:hypothetical protein